MIKISHPFIIAETPNSQIIFEIKPFDDFRSSFHKGKFYVIQRHFGKKIDARNLKINEANINRFGSSEDYNLDLLISSSVGNGNNIEPSIILDTKENTYTNRFFYKKAEIIKGGFDIEGPHSRDVKESLIITEEDEASHIEIEHIYSFFADSDVIAVKTKLINKGEDLLINRLCSLELPIASRNLDIYSFDGKWLKERIRHITNLESGIYIVDSKVGSSSHKHNPFIEIFDRENKTYYGFNLIYSGNHKEIIEVDPAYHSRILVGINDYCFAYEVKSSESFTTPEAIMVVSDNLDEITLEMQKFALNHIVNPVFKNKERPILFNNWEGTQMKIDEQSLIDMAQIASKVGVELFVVDDGWFKNRIDDTNGLGDWEVDKNKFPNGLGEFSKKIKSLGLKFGFWIEPEMICLKSDLYKHHPEFASLIPNREPIERRHQLIIDMSNPDVVDYLFNALSKVIDEAQPDYIKWDYNRFMSDNYSTYSKKGEFMHRFMMGSYSLMERLTQKYPNILFESCSSGGGRYDLGMLYYMPQTWGSDDSNTYWRSFISSGTLVGYPQSSFGAHVSRDGNPFSEGGRSSLEDRFNLNCFGAFGYEFDFRTFRQDELDIMSKQIKFYKNHRKLLQFGDFYLIDNPFDDDRYLSQIVVSNDKKEAMLLISELRPNVAPKIWKAKGLDEKMKYHVSLKEQYNLSKDQLIELDILGKDLMEKGLDLGSLYNTSDKKLYNGVYSRLIYIKEV